MAEIIDLKRNKLVRKKEIIVIIFSVILTTVGIKAADSLLSPDSENGSDDFCPIEMVRVPSPDGDFCIDKYESSPDEQCLYSDPQSQEETRKNIDQPTCKATSKFGLIPWRNISQNQAATACLKSGKRLPTNKEWLLASLGTPDSGNVWSSEDCQVNKNWDQQPGPAGTGINCLSSVGAYDMIGNVWEWVDGTVNEGKFKDKILPESGYVMAVDDEALPSETKLDEGDKNYYDDYFWIKNKGTRGMARGGYWDNKSEAGQYSLYAVSAPSFAGMGMGFRCVK